MAVRCTMPPNINKFNTLLYFCQFNLMSRILCQQCQRPSKACICAFVTPINNTIPVVVLQHRKEVNHSKGTVSLLAKSLKHCQVIVGENFTDNAELAKVLSTYNALLLYPSEQAKALPLPPLRENYAGVNSEHQQASKPSCLLILDGTWKKAYRMFMLTPTLQQLEQVCLPESIANNGQYVIRKVAKSNALSSLEACCYALALLESPNINSEQAVDLQVYQPLLNKFSQFNQFQLSFRQSDNC